jgi:hypothetical protein
MDDPLGQLRLRFTGLHVVSESGYGQVYAGQDFAGAPVTVAVLSEYAATDPSMRRTFGDVVQRHSPGMVPDQSAVYAADLHASRPWAAVRNPPGHPGAEQLFAGLGAGITPGGFPTPSGAGQPPAPGAAPAFPGGPGMPGAPGMPGGPGVPGGPGYPMASGPPGPNKPSSPWPWLIGVGAAVVALVVLVGVGVVAGNLLSDSEPEEPLAQPPPPLAPVQPEPPPPPADPEPTSPSLSDEEPQLRDLEPISVLGPTWSSGDDTYTMAFRGWPFAFRTPATWGCLGASYDPIPDAVAWSCRDEGDFSNTQRVNVMLWECDSDCSETEREDMIEQWLDDPSDAVRVSDPPVAYVEYDDNGRGNYGVDLSHFGGAGGEVRWHIGVYAESPAESRDVVLKVVNDIITQSY